MIDIIKAIRKTVTKRERKKLDYDRHRATLKKLQEKKDKTLKDEKAMYKAETEVETATQEFDYFNDLLKDELWPHAALSHPPTIARHGDDVRMIHLRRTRPTAKITAGKLTSNVAVIRPMQASP